MQKKLNIQLFIEQHQDWEKILSGAPYFINIKRDVMFGRNLVIFKYTMGESDFSIPVVRECRGLILDEDTLEPVCVPFFKFFNYGEPNVDDIDWKTAWTSSKLDGCAHPDTIIKTAEGEVTIKEICENPDKYHPLTFNHETGEFEEDCIQGTSILKPSNNWFEIIMEDGRSVKLTGNHKVWCNNLNCYRRVDELDGSEEFTVI